MNVQNTEPQSEFELFKELDKGVWIATKKDDPSREQFLARRIDAFDDLYKAVSEGRQLTAKDRETLAYKDLLFDFNQASAISRILNHENVVSIAGTIHRKPFIGAENRENASTEDYLVWDFCDAANLSVLFDDKPCEDPTYYLPESLCWHVLRSLVRAVAWLHDGTRLPSNVVFQKLRYTQYEFTPADFTQEDMPESIDKDWLRIVHRDIAAKNVWFQQPRGTETYGLCKLGNFSKAAVIGRAVPTEQPLPRPVRRVDEFSVTKREGWDTLEVLRRKCKEDPELYKPEDRVYTIEDELFAVGAVVFTMMTGQVLSHTCKKCGCCHIIQCKDLICCVLPDSDECECKRGGCEHVNKDPCETESKWKYCPHNCPMPNINYETSLIRTRYSKMLIQAVTSLIMSLDPKDRASLVSPTAEMMSLEIAYQVWRRDLAPNGYKDVEDDVEERKWAVKQKMHKEELQQEKLATLI